MDAQFRNLDFDPRKLPEEHLKAIGLACAAYAQTEDHVQLAIAGCLGIDNEYGWAITTHMSAPLRESVLKSVAEIRIDDLDDLDTLDDLLKIVGEAAKKRNAIAHHMWCTDEETSEVFTVRTTARVRVEADLIPMPIETIKADADFIYTAGIELLRFLLAKGLVPTLPPNDRARGHKSTAARKKRRMDQLGN